MTETGAMSLVVEMQQEELYLYARASGPRTVDNVSSIARQVIGACVQYRLDAALVDVRELHGRIGIMDAVMVPSRLFPSVKALGVLKRVAVLDIKKRGERLALFEKISRAGGHNIRAFAKLERAVEWLTSKNDAESID